MARTPEGKVKDAVTKILREVDASYFFPATGGYGRSGVSDIIACYRGRFIAIECKADGRNKPTELQLAYIEEVRNAGGVALVIHRDSLNDLRVLLETMK